MFLGPDYEFGRRFKIYRRLLPSRRIFVSNLTQNARFINPNAQNIYEYVILRS